MYGVGRVTSTDIMADGWSRLETVDDLGAADLNLMKVTKGVTKVR